MAKPTFQIWKDKPLIDTYGQYVQVVVDDYYSVGFDTDIATDDLYTNFSNLSRGQESELDQNTYFDQDSINLNDHIYGVGEFRIEHLRIKVNSELPHTNTENHNDSRFRVYFVDSAAFQCPTQTEAGCIGPDNRQPQQDVNPLTGEMISSEGAIYERWISDDDAFTVGRRLYSAEAVSNFDCAWGGDNEFEPNSSFELIGEKIVDNLEDANLSYYPALVSNISGLWRWRFFPWINHPNVTNSNTYNYENTRFPLDYDNSGEDATTPYDKFVIGQAFSNIADTTWGSDDNYQHDYDDGAFYLVHRYTGDRCSFGLSETSYSTISCANIYTIPKKLIYDNWNGYKPICFRWGTHYSCNSGDIVYSFSKPPVQKSGADYDKDYYSFYSADALVRVLPPRYFYENKESADAFRPVNNEEPDKHLKNPIEKDPSNVYFSQLTECLFQGQQIEIDGETEACTYSAFYPYLSEQVPYLYSPYYDVDYTGNLVGITDGTSEYDRTDGVSTGFTTSSNLTENILRSITLNTDYIRDRDFSPISYAWIGDDDSPDDGITVQRRYEINSSEEAQTSSPNFVNFSLSLASINKGTGGQIDTGVIDETNLFDFSDTKWVDDTYLGSGLGYKWCIARWGDEEDATTISDEELVEEFQIWSTSPDSYYEEVTQNGRFDWKNIKDDNGLGIFTHQYQQEGPKEVKAFVFSYIKNIDQSSTFNRLFNNDTIVPFQTLHWKLVTIRINLNLSEVFVEDFSEIGGNDFTYIPMKNLTPIVGGIHKQSNYVKSIKKIYDSNLFESVEILDKLRTEKAFKNDNMGYWPGKMDLEQIRLFKKPFDINYLLGIGNKVAVTANRFRPHDYKAYWDGIENSFSDETSVGEIFISDNIDVNLKSACILELNTSTLFGNKILDSSGNGNIGILIGDYKLSKTEILEPVTREGSMKTANIGTENGAI